MNRVGRYFLYGYIFSIGVAVGLMAKRPKVAAILIGSAIVMVELIELFVYIVLRIGL